MRIIVLSRNKDSYSTKRLRAAAVRHGHVVRVVDMMELSMLIEEKRPRIFFRGEALAPPDAVIPRIGASLTYYGTAIVRQFEQMGVFCLNTSRAITVSRDKLRSLQLLSRHDVGIPPSAFVTARGDLIPAIQRELKDAEVRREIVKLHRTVRAAIELPVVPADGALFPVRISRAPEQRARNGIRRRAREPGQ